VRRFRFLSDATQKRQRERTGEEDRPAKISWMRPCRAESAVVAQHPTHPASTTLEHPRCPWILGELIMREMIVNTPA